MGGEVLHGVSENLPIQSRLCQVSQHFDDGANKEGKVGKAIANNQQEGFHVALLILVHIFDHKDIAHVIEISHVELVADVVCRVCGIKHIHEGFSPSSGCCNHAIGCRV